MIKVRRACFVIAFTLALTATLGYFLGLVGVAAAIWVFPVETGAVVLKYSCLMVLGSSGIAILAMMFGTDIEGPDDIPWEQRGSK